jgi:hypothetical protein
MAAQIYKASSAADLEFGITDESNIVVTSYSRNVQSQKTEVRDAENEVVAVAYTGLTAAIKLEGYVNGTVAMLVANAFPLTNDTSSYGLSGGTVIIDQISETTGQGEFKRISVDLTQYGETMTAA